MPLPRRCTMNRTNKMLDCTQSRMKIGFVRMLYTCKKHLKIWNEMTSLDKGILINEECSGALLKELKLEALIFQSTDNETIIFPCTKCLYFRTHNLRECLSSLHLCWLMFRFNPGLLENLQAWKPMNEAVISLF